MPNPTQIELSQVRLDDDTYNYHYWEYEINPLRRSISAHGILTPCVLEEREHGYRIVHGFRRIHTAREQALGTIPAIVADTTPFDLLKNSLLDNRVPGPFNTYEQSKAMQIARKLGATSSQVIEDILPLLGLNPHKNVYDEYRGFIRLPKALIEFFVEKDTPVSRTQVFQNLAKDGIEITLEILDRFSPGINILDELISNLYEISRREERPVSGVYRTLDVESIFEETGQPHVALGAIRRRLHEYRYPVLSSTNREIRELTDRLNLGENVRIQWDKRLENRGVNVTYHWETVAEMNESAEKLTMRENLALLDKVFQKI